MSCKYVRGRFTKNKNKIINKESNYKVSESAQVDGPEASVMCSLVMGQAGRQFSDQ